MNKATGSEDRRGRQRHYVRVLEVVLVLAVIPALLHGVTIFNGLPGA